MCHFGLDRLFGGQGRRGRVGVVGGISTRMWTPIPPSDVQVGRLMLAFSAIGLDMRIWELLLLRMDS